MRRNKNYIFRVLVLLVSVVAVGMVHAGFSQTLTSSDIGYGLQSSIAKVYYNGGSEI